MHFKACPVVARYMHGKVETKIQQVKKSMNVNMSKNLLSILQWETLGQEIANGVNNLPLGLGNIVKDLDILTPNRLLLGRNNDRCPLRPLKTVENIKLLNIYATWFKSWLISYVPTLLDRPKCFKSDENIEVGDVVLFQKPEKE